MDVAYEGRGLAGPALVLVHGFPADRRMWRGQLAGLGAHARVIALDLPGFGASPSRADDTFTMDAMADVVMALADGLGIERMVLAGLSMGGYVVFSALRRYAARLDGAILLDTRAEPDAATARESRLADAERALTEGPGFLYAKLADVLFAAGTAETRPELAREVEGWIAGQSRTGVAAALRGKAARPDARPQLAGIAVPTLVVAGHEDRITPAAGMRSMAAAIPGATYAEVPGGHVAPLEHPDEVNAAIALFLSRLPEG
jgi:pimeloyl-ACP methyl ester carboxylesterase